MTSIDANRHRSLWLCSIVVGSALAVLAGCGGGGGGSADTPLSLTGTAAAGAAISGKTVEAKCAAGSGSATTAADGTFTISFTSATLPCVLHVTAPDGSVLHSVATGTGGSAVANINPVTHMVVAALAAGDPVAFYGSFASTMATSVNASAIAAAVAFTMDTLKSKGYNVSAFGNVLTDKLVAANGATAGNAYDQALDALKASMASSSTTLDQLTQTVVVATASTPSLPHDLLDKPHASNCAALRSGSYRVVSPQSGTTLASQHGTFTLDAATLKLTNDDASIDTFTENGACRFSIATGNGTADIVVSQAGVLVARILDDNLTTYHLAIAFPQQTHTLAELAGVWNMLGIETISSSTTFTGTAANVTLDATGSQSSATACHNETTWSVSGADCQSVTPTNRFKANSAGGFDIADVVTGAVNGRAFVYQAGGGELMMLKVDADGSLQVRTKQRTNGLPTVGAVTTTWNLSTGTQLTSTNAVSEDSNTITSVDSVAHSWNRTRKTVGGTDEHPETLFANNPRDGYTFRAAGSALAVDGTTVTFREFTGLGLRGMGVSALVLPVPKLFMFSVIQP